MADDCQRGHACESLTGAPSELTMNLRATLTGHFDNCGDYATLSSTVSPQLPYCCRNEGEDLPGAESSVVFHEKNGKHRVEFLQAVVLAAIVKCYGVCADLTAGVLKCGAKLLQVSSQIPVYGIWCV